MAKAFRRNKYISQQIKNLFFVFCFAITFLLCVVSVNNMDSQHKDTVMIAIIVLYPICLMLAKQCQDFGKFISLIGKSIFVGYLVIISVIAVVGSAVLASQFLNLFGDNFARGMYFMLVGIIIASNFILQTKLGGIKIKY